MKPLLSLLIAGILCASCRAGFGQSPQVPSSAPRWNNGPPTNENYFPIGVWLQDPKNAARYKAAGVNVYVGLWRGPTTNQLAQLQQAGMQVICAQNRLGLEQTKNPTIIGWTHGEKTVWNCIECTHIGNPNIKATPQQVSAEVWMSLIHGSRGLIYFVHQFKPTFKEAALLDDPEMLAAITKINRHIADLAPALNSPTIADAASVKSSVPDVPIAMLVKRRANVIHLFAVNMRGQPTTGSFSVRETPEVAEVLVRSESRSLTAKNGQFTDGFAAYDVHLYELRAHP